MCCRGVEEREEKEEKEEVPREGGQAINRRKKAIKSKV